MLPVRVNRTQGGEIMHVFHKYEVVLREEAWEKIHGGNWCPYQHMICSVCGRIQSAVCSSNGAYWSPNWGPNPPIKDIHSIVKGKV